MDRGAWLATPHRVAKSQTQLKWLSTKWIITVVPATEAIGFRWLLLMTVVLFTETLNVLSPNAHQTITHEMCPLWPELKHNYGEVKTEAQNYYSVRNQKSKLWAPWECHGWSPVTLLLLLCLPSGIDVRWCNITSTLEIENKWNIFLTFFFILSFYFFLYWTSFSYLSPSSPPLPLSGSGWFLGIFKLRHTWGMRKLMLFSKSFFFFFTFWPFCALEIAFNISLLQVFPFNFLDFFSTWKKSTNLVLQYRIMGASNSPTYDSSVTGIL